MPDPLNWFSNWIHSKESKVLEIFDFKIAAAENEIEYEKASFRQIFPFDHVVLEPGKVRKHEHCFHYSTDHAHIKIFDEFYSKTGPEYTGIRVELKEFKLPDLDIARSDAPLKIYPHSYMSEMDLAPSADWLSGAFKVLTPYKEPTEPIIDLLARSYNLQALLERSQFFLLTIREEHLCLYYKMSIQADSLQIHQLKEDANLLVTIFTSSTDDQIEQLKRDEQADDEGNAEDTKS